MTEQDRIEAERKATLQMKDAALGMQAVLDRVRTLEQALSSAASALSSIRPYIGPNCYQTPLGSNAPKLVLAALEEAVAAARKPL